MIWRRVQKRRPRRISQGLTLIEVVISTLLVGLVLVSSLRSLGHVASSRESNSDDARAVYLAEELLTEVLNQGYVDSGGSPVFGPEPGESGADRTGFDDVDDYNGWSSAPPVDRDGNVLPNSADWQRDVLVEYVDPANPSVASGVDQGVLRVTCTVRRNGVALAALVVLKSERYATP